MGGVNVDSGSGGRRSLDSEINMIPMIDLLMVTISFLLITAVWSQMARIEANAQVPGPPTEQPPGDPPPKEKQLHIEMRSPEKFTLSWKEGATVVSTVDVPRHDVVNTLPNGRKQIRYPELADKIESEWKTGGAHREAGDKKFDQAILHSDNETQYLFLVGVIDALYKAQREFTPPQGGKPVLVPAFNVTFSVN